MPLPSSTRPTIRLTRAMDASIRVTLFPRIRRPWSTHASDGALALDSLQALAPCRLAQNGDCGQRRSRA